MLNFKLRLTAPITDEKIQLFAALLKASRKKQTRKFIKKVAPSNREHR